MMKKRRPDVTCSNYLRCVRDFSRLFLMECERRVSKETHEDYFRHLFYFIKKYWFERNNTCLYRPAIENNHQIECNPSTVHQSSMIRCFWIASIKSCFFVPDALRLFSRQYSLRIGTVSLLNWKIEQSGPMNHRDVLVRCHTRLFRAAASTSTSSSVLLLLLLLDVTDASA